MSNFSYTSKDAQEADNPESLQRMVNDAFNQAIQNLKKKSKHHSVKNSDLTGSVLKRRKLAAMVYTPYVMDRYQQKFPLLNLPHIFLESCSSSHFPLQSIEKAYDLSLAMALYILDILREYDLLGDAEKYLDIPSEKLSDLDIPPVKDYSTAESLLAPLVYIIQHRDVDNADYRYYISEESAKISEEKSASDYKESCTGDLSCRTRFNAIMSLIPLTVQNKAKDRFLEHMWSFWENELLIIDRHMCQISDKLKSAAKLHDEYLHIIKQNKQELVGDLSADHMSVLKYTQKKPCSNTMTDMTDSAAMSQLLAIERLRFRQEQLRKQATALSALCRSIIEYSSMIAFEDTQLEGAYSTEDLEILWGISIDDPFETCFAYLCLIESGSNIPWLYNLPNTVLMLAARKLPWIIPMCMPSTYKKYQANILSAGGQEDSLFRPNQIDIHPEYYELGVNNTFCESEDETSDNTTEKPLRVNVAQIIYELTGVLIPRKYDIFSGIHKDLIAEGMDEGYARCLELCLHFIHDFRLNEYRNTTLPKDSEIKASQALEEKISQLENSIKLLKDENSGLKTELHEVKASAESSQEKLAKVLSDANEQNQELANLRELIYRQANEHNSSQEPEATDGIRFPYKTNCRYAVFGGHDTWLKAIRPLLPNVTFITRGQLPNAELIKRQDAIWIQPNAISHADYYKIINITRANHIPMYYFGYASAQKCALQLVKEDCKEIMK